MPSPPLPKNVRVDALGGGSDAAATGDGKLCVGGTADPGSMVTVTITGPSGAVSMQSVTPEASDCRFKVCFPEGAGDLPEGQYSVQVVQGTSAVDTRIGVP
jgi:hypothetical protein